MKYQVGDIVYISGQFNPNIKVGVIEVMNNDKSYNITGYYYSQYDI